MVHQLLYRNKKIQGSDDSHLRDLKFKSFYLFIQFSHDLENGSRSSILLWVCKPHGSYHHAEFHKINTVTLVSTWGKQRSSLKPPGHWRSAEAPQWCTSSPPVQPRPWTGNSHKNMSHLHWKMSCIQGLVYTGHKTACWKIWHGNSLQSTECYDYELHAFPSQLEKSWKYTQPFSLLPSSFAELGTQIIDF